jgi:hypothetical protein
MSAFLLNPDDFTYGDPDKLRAEIAALMAAVGMRSNIVADYAALRDDAGLRYTLRCAAAEFRVALSLLGDLTEQTERTRKRQQPDAAAQPHSGTEARR